MSGSLQGAGGESCRRHGINQREYLLDVLTRLPAMKITEVAELTPARWLAAKRAAARNQAASFRPKRFITVRLFV